MIDAISPFFPVWVSALWGGVSVYISIHEGHALSASRLSKRNTEVPFPTAFLLLLI